MGVKRFRIYNTGLKQMCYGEDASDHLPELVAPGAVLRNHDGVFFMSEVGMNDSLGQLIYEDDVVRLPNGAYGAVEFINGAYGITTLYEQNTLTHIPCHQVPWDKCRVVSDLFETISKLSEDSNQSESLRTPEQLLRAISILNSQNN